MFVTLWLSIKTAVGVYAFVIHFLIFLLFVFSLVKAVYSVIDDDHRQLMKYSLLATFAFVCENSLLAVGTSSLWGCLGCLTGAAAGVYLNAKNK